VEGVLDMRQHGLPTMLVLKVDEELLDAAARA